jgi:uncharacterized membrane protein YfcA
MDARTLTPIIFAASTAAGFLGALTGLGGGVVIVPLLSLGFGVNIRYAIGASLVSVIATSSGAAAAYVREGYTNIRVAMLLEVATTTGALAGAVVAAGVRTHVIAIVFGVVLAASALMSFRRRRDPPRAPPDALATRLRLDPPPATPGGDAPYHVRGVVPASALMFGAGALSGLLGIGSGAVKVLAMDDVMHLPFKTSTTTSNFMIGVTAAAGAGVYLSRGYIDPVLAFPVMLGVLLGSVVGARVMTLASARALRVLFGAVILALAAEMIWGGLTRRL